jgi:hypothetical protein
MNSVIGPGETSTSEILDLDVAWSLGPENAVAKGSRKSREKICVGGFKLIG